MLGYALSLGPDPDASHAIFGLALTLYDDTPVGASKTGELLLQQARQLWIDGRTEDALCSIIRTVALADAHHLSSLRKLAYGRMTGFLLQLTRYEEAEASLEAVGQLHENDNSSIRLSCYIQKATLAATMRECSVGIFIASADENGVDAKGSPVKKARENVIYELGAASFAYGQRIVIFKEKGVEFPSDFSDLGYIEFEKGHLAEKFSELIGELVKLKAVRISAGGN